MVCTSVRGAKSADIYKIAYSAPAPVEAVIGAPGTLFPARRMTKEVRWTGRVSAATDGQHIATIGVAPNVPSVTVRVFVIAGAQ